MPQSQLPPVHPVIATRATREQVCRRGLQGRRPLRSGAFLLPLERHRHVRSGGLGSPVRGVIHHRPPGPPAGDVSAGMKSVCVPKIHVYEYFYALFPSLVDDARSPRGRPLFHRGRMFVVDPRFLPFLFSSPCDFYLQMPALQALQEYTLLLSLLGFSAWRRTILVLSSPEDQLLCWGKYICVVTTPRVGVVQSCVSVSPPSSLSPSHYILQFRLFGYLLHAPSPPITISSLCLSWCELSHSVYVLFSKPPRPPTLHFFSL